MSEPIELDLRRDLPKVREALDQLIAEEGSCRYSTPCAIGVMMSPKQRASLGYLPGGIVPADYQKITNLIEGGAVVMPADQHSDAARLQRAFDNRSHRAERLPIVLAELESKYLSQPEASGK